MKTETEFDLIDFQNKVLKDFNGIAATMAFAGLHTKGYKAFENKEEPLDLSFSPIGLFTRGVLAFFSFLGKRADKNTLKSPDFIEKKKRASEIINRPKIKKILCRDFKRKIVPNLSKEERRIRIIKIVTTLLTKEEFSIEKDVRLFSLITIKILKTGLENYCC